MASRDDLKRSMDESDIHTLEEAARVIKRRDIRPSGYSQAALRRLLRAEAALIRKAHQGAADPGDGLEDD